MKVRPGKFFWKLFLGTAALVTVVVATIVALIILVNDDLLAAKTADSLKRYAELFRHQVAGKLDADHANDLQSFVSSEGDNGAEGYRITVVTRDGTVLADSSAPPSSMENHATRPEIQSALADGFGDSTRFSNTINRQMKYVAVRVGSGENPEGVVRVAMQYGTFVAQSKDARRLAMTIALVGLLAAAVLALGLARIWSGPISRITAIAREFSHGQLSAQLRVEGSDEITLLAKSLNRMRDRLAAHLESHYRQRRTLEYLLTQLHEGVIVADADGRIILLNPAAAKLLDVPVSMTGGRDIEGISVESCVPQAELRHMLAVRDVKSAHSNGHGTADLEHGLHTEPSVLLENRITLKLATGTVSVLARASDIVLPAATASLTRITDSTKPPAVDRTIVGRLLVLTDITELSQAMRIKSDFVANASHELRTPLTAIRTGVETLLSIDPAEDESSAKHLLGVVDRHSARLEAMVDDLLELSRLESSANSVRPSQVLLVEVLRELRDRFAKPLESKGINLETTTADDQPVTVPSARLLRLVLNNLVDNAVKFTDPGGNIGVTFDQDENAIRFAVTDDGCGIPPKEHDRIFERFYQVERARSGADRGTGLGLSIVRHAVAAMNGSVQLTSEPGEGTRIAIEIPLSSTDRMAETVAEVGQS